MAAKKIVEQAQARELRKQGMSVRKIAEYLSVSKASVSSWVRDVELSEEQKDLLRKENPSLNKEKRGAGGEAWSIQARAKRQRWQEEGRKQAQKQESLHLQGCMLYWAEGAKNKNTIKFCNSDSEMMSLFMKFLLHYFDIDLRKFSLTVNCYSQNPRHLEEIQNYWLNLLKLPASCLRDRKQDDRARGTILPRKNRLDYGICELVLNNTEITQKIFGAIQEYVGMPDSRWLD